MPAPAFVPAAEFRGSAPDVRFRTRAIPLDDARVTAMLTLHVDSRFMSPWAMAAFVALRAKGLAFETVPIELAAGASKAADYRALSITARVPTLVHDGFALSESSAICEYLDDTFPGPALYPRGARERARARQVQAWLRSDLMALRQERDTTVLFRHPIARPLSPAGEAAAAALIEAAERLLPEGQASLTGAWNIADTDLAAMLGRLVLNGDPVPERLAAYMRAEWQRPAVQEWVALSRRAET